MKIAFVSHWSGRGGAEKALLEIIQAVRKFGHQPFCFVPCDGWLVRELESINVDVVRVSYPWWAAESMPAWLRAWHVLRLPLAVFRLAMNLKAGRFDLVYSNSIVICAGALAARLAGIPHVWHVHEYIRPESGHSFHFGFDFSVRLIRRYSDLVIGASQEVLRSLHQQGATLYLPPNVSPVVKRPAAKPTLVCIGHFVESRRHRDAIAALRLLRECGYDVCLRIVGDGEQRSALELQAAGLPVTFVGSVPDASQEIANATILVNCNSVEAYGRVNVEAMSLRTPIVAARSGANTEIIRDNETGLLFELGNPQSLADQVARILSDPALAKRLADNAYVFVGTIGNDLSTTLDRLLRPLRRVPLQARSGMSRG